MISVICARMSTDISGIFSKHFSDNIINIYASGSSKQDVNGSMQMTQPEYAIYPWNKKYDWCSNCARSYDNMPWITFSLKDRKLKIRGYFVRCGCCYDHCCCEDDAYGCFDCCLYSWALQISNDNKTWTEVHRIEKDNTMRRCNEKTYKLDKEYLTTYVRLIQISPYPGDPPCMAINKFELFGEVEGENGDSEDFVSYHDDDEDVSIIGHISKNHKIPVE